MTIGQLLKEGESQLSHREMARLEVQVLLAWILELTKEQLFCSYDEGVTEDTIERFSEAVRLLAEDKPLAYITHEKEFYGLDFYVDGRVLIPRPETEWLVEKVIALSRSRGFTKIVDVGTGSGAIGLSLAVSLPPANVVLVDISPDALDVTRMNASRFGVTERVIIQKSDLLNTICDQYFDVIVANLPYIGTEKFHFVAADVDRYEPHLALYGGSDGLQLYTKLFQQIVDMPHQPKYLLAEYGFAQTEELRALLDTFFVQLGATYAIVQDLAGIDRYFIVSFEGLPL